MKSEAPPQRIPAIAGKGELPATVRKTRFLDVTILTITEEADFADILTAIWLMGEEQPDGLFVWDLRRAPSLADLPEGMLLSTVGDVLMPSARSRGSSRSAYVVTRDVDLNAMRRLVDQAGRRGYGATLNVFRSDKAALNWVLGRG